MYLIYIYIYYNRYIIYINNKMYCWGLNNLSLYYICTIYIWWWWWRWWLMMMMVMMMMIDDWWLMIDDWWLMIDDETHEKVSPLPGPTEHTIFIHSGLFHQAFHHVSGRRHKAWRTRGGRGLLLWMMILPKWRTAISPVMKWLVPSPVHIKKHPLTMVGPNDVVSSPTKPWFLGFNIWGEGLTQWWFTNFDILGQPWLHTNKYLNLLPSMVQCTNQLTIIFSGRYLRFTMILGEFYTI